VLECWSAGVLECWSVGVLEYWSIGVLEYWSIGVLECWSIGVLECWSVGRLKCFAPFPSTIENRGFLFATSSRLRSNRPVVVLVLIEITDTEGNRVGVSERWSTGLPLNASLPLPLITEN
jgi:hypothetical protein